MRGQSAKKSILAIKPLSCMYRTCYAKIVAPIRLANAATAASASHSGKTRGALKGISMGRKTPRINRFSQIVRFLRVSRLLLWTIWVIYRERRRVVRARERGNYEVQPNVEVLIQVLVVFRRTAVKLGVLMIKLGQFLSSRADLLPERALEVLSSLQDEVP